ncbi:citrate/2-methylcitrate synthase [Methanolobus sp. ZRKC2]|uniref:citrate/2-methylcitrate synthase n=1 Tax=Methanolobus sp. ZRKC2 TaxID=3125783 RepID=UPI0032526802
MDEIRKGLENVIALETKIAYIDGMQGILKYRGHDINDLVNLSYDAVSYLLLRGNLPDDKELEVYSDQLKKERAISEDVLNVLTFCNFNIEAMDALRTAISYISHCDPDMDDNSSEANIRKGMRMIASFPTIVAAFYRIKSGQVPLEPDLNMSQGAYFLYMIRGTEATETEAEIIEKDFILSAEHELNPSTFATRLATSTLSDVYSAVIAGLCTLKGPLHGGARMEVMEMLDEVKSPERAGSYVADKIENHDRLMGFGHRVYKTYDPRGLIYKDLAREIADEKGNSIWFDIAESIEKAAFKEFVENKGKTIYPNVDFYSAVVYKYLEIPPRLATAVFAIGRISGWIAHCLEQYSDNRVIRPRAKFVEI